MIRRGRLVLVIGGQESQTSSRDHQTPVHLDQMVLVMAWREAGPCDQGLHSLIALKGELENNSWQPRNLTGKRQSDRLNKSQLFLVGSDQGGIIVAEDDDDG
jgi:hypothetical protein